MMNYKEIVELTLAYEEECWQLAVRNKKKSETGETIFSEKQVQCPG